MDAPALATAAGAAFATGLPGGLHCAGMCGGIVAALSAPSGVPAPGVATAVRCSSRLALQAWHTAVGQAR